MKYAVAFTAGTMTFGLVCVAVVAVVIYQYIDGILKGMGF